MDFPTIGPSFNQVHQLALSCSGATDGSWSLRKGTTWFSGSSFIASSNTPRNEWIFAPQPRGIDRKMHISHLTLTFF